MTNDSSPSLKVLILPCYLNPALVHQLNLSLSLATNLPCRGHLSTGILKGYENIPSFLRTTPRNWVSIFKYSSHTLDYMETHLKSYLFASSSSICDEEYLNCSNTLCHGSESGTKHQNCLKICDNTTCHELTVSPFYFWKVEFLPSLFWHLNHATLPCLSRKYLASLCILQKCYAFSLKIYP